MANLTTTTETATMKISTTVTETKSVEKEIPLPFFGKEGQNFYKIKSKDKVVQVYNHAGLHMITVQEMWLCKDGIARALENPITEKEFEAELDIAAGKVYEPIEDEEEISEKPSRYKDENEEIDEMIYGGRL